MVVSCEAACNFDLLKIFSVVSSALGLAVIFCDGVFLWWFGWFFCGGVVHVFVVVFFVVIVCGGIFVWWSFGGGLVVLFCCNTSPQWCATFAHWKLEKWQMCFSPQTRNVLLVRNLPNCHAILVF